MHFSPEVYDVAMFFRKKRAAEFVPVILPDPMQGAGVMPAGTEETMSPRKKVLVVDDDSVVAKTLWLTLNSRGYQVLCAADAAQAIKMMREQNPDVMLVDVGLPPDIAMGGANLTDGFQVTRWLQLANTRKIPSIIISGSDKPAYRRQAAAVGADGFLPKPINENALVDSIECALAHPAPVAEGFATFKMAASSFAD
ncbi:MAG TPA: response regulator [Verrucomicrobiae bacterium]|nr:response regulator [Verrucomicrobiae bacterium]